MHVLYSALYMSIVIGYGLQRLLLSKCILNVVLIICMSNFYLIHAFIAMWYSRDCVSFFSFSSFERMLDSKLREEESNIRVLVPDVKLYK